jgi:hypothetical protein
MFSRLAPQVRVALAIGASMLMPLACDSEPSTLSHRSTGGGDDAPPPADAPGNTKYDPQQPTNQGPTLNAAGFAAIAPIVETHCSECHHAGTWLDLKSGADAATAAKVVAAVHAGTMPPAPRAALSADEIAKLDDWQAGRVPAAAAPAPPISSSAAPQILDASTLASYRAALPKVGWPRLDAILASPSTIFWDKTVMPGAYQDTVGDGASLPLGARLNSEGKSLIVPEGKKLFSDDGTTWAFPFGHTAGADAASGAIVIDFMNLPAPIVTRVETGSVDGLPINRWNWAFPKGAIVGEVVFVRIGSSLVATELRVRERWDDKWSTNAFRPFPTAKLLASAIETARPSYASDANLSALHSALLDTTTLSPKHLDSPAFANIVTLDGASDAPLPAIADDVVTDLLGKSTFVAAYGTAWKTNGSLTAFGATSSGRSIVPAGFDLGVLEVRESTCTKCHDQGGTFIGDIVDQAILYGDVWGVDRIFSFYPFDPSRIDASGNENRVVRSAFAEGGVVVTYDASVHSSYTFYRPAK